MPETQHDRERFSREQEFARRIDKLEEGHQKMSDGLIRLTSSVEKMSHGIDSMRETLSKVLDNEEKAHNRTMEKGEKIHLLQLKIANLESKMGLVMLVGSALIVSFIGLGVTTLFGSP